MNIQLITNDKKRFLPLLLLADEQEAMIDRCYLERGELFVMHGMQEAEVIAVAVVTNGGNGVCAIQLCTVPFTGKRAL